MRSVRFLVPLLVGTLLASSPLAYSAKKEKEKKPYDKGAGGEWLVFPGNGTSPNQHAVFLAGDEESRSEEALPVLAQALSTQFGWKCTVLFCLEDSDGNVDPNEPTHMPNLGVVSEATLLVLSLRHREFSAADTGKLLDFWKKGGPTLGLRHSLAAFSFDSRPGHDFAFLDWQSPVAAWSGGFGPKVLGSRWLDNWSRPNQATQVLPEMGVTHPILEGFQPFQSTSPVTQVKLDPQRSQILLRGQVLESQEPNAPAATGARKNQQINDPLMPVAWTYQYQIPEGQPGSAFMTTLGSAQDFAQPIFAQLVANAACVLVNQPPAKLTAWPTAWKPSASGFMGFKKNTKPKDLLPK